jgi:succinate dehydrogenase/fumarate reductase flavoprotein subunit
MAFEEKVVETDIVIIGGGLAGESAAIRARMMSDLDVTLVEKGYVGRSGGSSFAGGFSSLFNTDWGHDFNAWKDHALNVGEYINNQDWLDIHLRSSWARYQELFSWGVPYSKDEKGNIIEFMSLSGTTVPITYVRLLSMKSTPVLRKKALEVGVKVLDRIMVTDLLKQDGRVVGVVGFDTREGDFYTIKAKATIVAAGQGTFKNPGYPHDYWTGDGECMCYRAGAELVGKEFGQQCEYIFREHPALFTVVGAGRGRNINGLGEEYLGNYFRKSKRGMGSPDHTHKTWMFEVDAGRGPAIVDLDVPMDSETVKEKLIEEESRILRMYVRERVGHNLRSGQHEILQGGSVGATGPAAGGVLINTKCETGIPGLYAAGDTAGTNMSGSLYIMVGWGLTTAVITGYVAGEAAVGYAKSAEKAQIDSKEVDRLKEVAYAPLNRKSGFRSSWVLQMIQNTMVPYYITGIKRKHVMEAALTLVNFIQGHLVPKMRAQDPHELRMANEVRNMGKNAEMVLRASLFRTESRGRHYREDYPRRDDPNWLAWTILKEAQGEMTLRKQPLPKEWWPDLSKPYGERYDFRFPGEEE